MNIHDTPCTYLFNIPHRNCANHLQLFFLTVIKMYWSGLFWAIQDQARLNKTRQGIALHEPDKTRQMHPDFESIVYSMTLKMVWIALPLISWKVLVTIHLLNTNTNYWEIDRPIICYQGGIIYYNFGECLPADKRVLKSTHDTFIVLSAVHFEIHFK